MPHSTPVASRVSDTNFVNLDFHHTNTNGGAFDIGGAVGAGGLKQLGGQGGGRKPCL